MQTFKVFCHAIHKKKFPIQDDIIRMVLEFVFFLYILLFVSYYFFIIFILSFPFFGFFSDPNLDHVYFLLAGIGYLNGLVFVCVSTIGIHSLKLISDLFLYVIIY